MKTAIVGCGSIASVHAACIHKMLDHQLVAFADCDIIRAEKFADQYGGRAYASLELMLDAESIDVLHICTPHYLHTPMAIYGLKSGVHVFMEKPPVINIEQLNQLKSLSTDRKLGFCFQNRYNPSVIKVKEMISSGITGKIIGAKGIVTWNRDEDYYIDSGWRGSLMKEGGGALINQSIHTLDLLQYFIDEKPITIDAIMANHHLKGKIEVEDTVSAYITYKDARVCFFATTAYSVNSAPFIELECEKVRIRIEEMEVVCYHKNGLVEQIPVESKTGFGKSYWGAGHEDCIHDFYDSIVNNCRFLQDLEGMEDTIRLMLHVYESGRTRSEVKW